MRCKDALHTFQLLQTLQCMSTSYFDACRWCDGSEPAVSWSCHISPLLLGSRLLALQVLINAGQANAATGDKGYADCHTSAKSVSEALGIQADDVLLLSTGVIGRPIKLEALLKSVPTLASRLGSSARDAHHAAVAITTTDLVSKSAALEVTPFDCMALAFVLLST